MKKLFNFLKSIPTLKISLIILIICFVIFVPSDPDFLWHLKYGELTFKFGPISDDLFTYSFSDYHFYDYEWLSHVLINILYKIGQFYLVALFYGFVVLSAFFVSIKIPVDKIDKKTNIYIKLILIILGLVTCSTIIQVRPQMISLLGLALTFFILQKFTLFKSKLIYLLPLLFFLWANLHPGYFSGLFLIFLFLLKEFLIFSWNIIKNKTQNYHNFKILLIISLASLLCVFLTPFTYKSFIQAVNFAMDDYASDIILEWLAPNFHKISGQVAVIYII